jgi:hypothetical protein
MAMRSVSGWPPADDGPKVAVVDADSVREGEDAAAHGHGLQQILARFVVDFLDAVPQRRHARPKSFYLLLQARDLVRLGGEDAILDVLIGVRPHVTAASRRETEAEVGRDAGFADVTSPTNLDTPGSDIWQALAKAFCPPRSSAARRAISRMSRVV